MNHRHLLPTEIDLLLDDEEGFGVAPLKAHVRACPECMARLEDARLVTDAIEELPHFAPSFSFADAVMAKVPVFVPWHVAARDAVRDAVREWVPESRPARAVAFGLATSVATVLTVGILWIASQTDLLVFATGIAGRDARRARPLRRLTRCAAHIVRLADPRPHQSGRHARSAVVVRRLPSYRWSNDVRPA